MKQQWKLISQDTKAYVCRQIMASDFGKVVVLQDPPKSRDQEAKYHAMFSDIARQCTFMGEKWSSEDWKRLLVDSFARVMSEQGTPLAQQGRIVPALDGKGFVQLGIQTRMFRKAEASEFIEFLLAWGAENGVRWTAPRYYYEDAA